MEHLRFWLEVDLVDCIRIVWLAIVSVVTTTTFRCRFNHQVIFDILRTRIGYTRTCGSINIHFMTICRIAIKFHLIMFSRNNHIREPHRDIACMKLSICWFISCCIIRITIIIRFLQLVFCRACPVIIVVPIVIGIAYPLLVFGDNFHGEIECTITDTF